MPTVSRETSQLYAVREYIYWQRRHELDKNKLNSAHLYNNTCYKFSVTTLNGVSTEANKKHWNSAMIRVQFSGKTNRNHPDACKLIWKNQPYFEGNRKGVFLAFSTAK